MRVMEHNLRKTDMVALLTERKFCAVAVSERVEQESENGFFAIDIQRAIQGARGDTIALARLLPKLFKTLRSSYWSLIRHLERGDIARAKKLVRFIGNKARAFGVIHIAKTATRMEQAIKGEVQSFTDECIINMGLALNSFERELLKFCPKI